MKRVFLIIVVTYSFAASANSAWEMTSITDANEAKLRTASFALKLSVVRHITSKKTQHNPNFMIKYSQDGGSQFLIEMQGENGTTATILADKKEVIFDESDCWERRWLEEGKSLTGEGSEQYEKFEEKMWPYFEVISPLLWPISRVAFPVPRDSVRSFYNWDKPSITSLPLHNTMFRFWLKQDSNIRIEFIYDAQYSQPISIAAYSGRYCAFFLKYDGLEAFSGRIFPKHMEFGYGESPRITSELISFEQLSEPLSPLISALSKKSRMDRNKCTNAFPINSLPKPLSPNLSFADSLTDGPVWVRLTLIAIILAMFILPTYVGAKLLYRRLWNGKSRHYSASKM